MLFHRTHYAYMQKSRHSSQAFYIETLFSVKPANNKECEMMSSIASAVHLKDVCYMSYAQINGVLSPSIISRCLQKAVYFDGRYILT